MIRATSRIALLGWLAAWPAFAGIGGYLVGSVTLGTRENADLYSAGIVTCYTYVGDIDDSCNLSGEHFIYDTMDNSKLIYRSYATITEYNDYLRRLPLEEHCYRARVTGAIYGTSTSNYWGSSMTCRVRLDPIDMHPGCPILLDLDMNGFHLAGIEEAVGFDLNADGIPEQLAWTAAGERDAFLCRDRNHNGLIDDGRELFGQETLLSTGERAQIAYAALAELDQPELGGNLDGVVGPEDAAFQELCAWVDENHDGISQYGEMTALQDAKVVRLDYDYIDSRHRDAHDNLFHYKSRAWILTPSGQERVTNAYDVFFRVP